MLQLHHGTPTPHAIAMADLSDFYLVEAGEVVKNDIYKAWLIQQREAGKIIILDNGAGIKEPVQWAVVRKVYDEIQPTYVVLPDTLYEKDKTLNACKKALEGMPHGGHSVWKT